MMNWTWEQPGHYTSEHMQKADKHDLERDLMHELQVEREAQHPQYRTANDL